MHEGFFEAIHNHRVIIKQRYFCRAAMSNAVSTASNETGMETSGTEFEESSSEQFSTTGPKSHLATTERKAPLNAPKLFRLNKVMVSSGVAKEKADTIDPAQLRAEYREMLRAKNRAELLRMAAFIGTPMVLTLLCLVCYIAWCEYT